MKFFQPLAILVGALSVVAGCGGGGGSTPDDPGTSSMVPVYVTDAPGDYAQAWVTVKKVEVSGSRGAKAVYQDPVGATFDLVALNSAGQQRFALLGIADVPAGNNLQVKITVDEKVTLVPTGTTTGTVYTIAGSNGGTKVLTYSAPRKGSEAVIIDFVLAEWQVQGGQVVAVVRAGDPSKLGHGSNVDQSFAGTVSRLTGTAPDLAFVLSNDHMGVHVVTNAETHVSNHDGTENPVIRDGATVHIRGAFDHQANTVTATEVVIRNQHHVDSAAADGTVGSVGTDSFTLAVHNAYRFHPSHSTMTVTTSEATTFAIGGVAAHSTDFYAAVKVEAVVAVHGAYDPTTNTFAATHVGLIRHGHENHHRVAATGPVSEVNAHAGTFNLTMRAWEGAELRQGAVIHVVTNAHTQFEGLTLDHLSNGESVRVVGVLEGSTLTAMSVSRSHHP